MGTEERWRGLLFALTESFVSFAGRSLCDCDGWAPGATEQAEEPPHYRDWRRAPLFYSIGHVLGSELEDLDARFGRQRFKSGSGLGIVCHLVAFSVWLRRGVGPNAYACFHACCRYAESDMRPEGKGGVATTRPGATSLQLNPSAICVYKYNIAPRLAESQPGAERPRRESSHWQELRDLGN